jgi:hypothetical protein
MLGRVVTLFLAAIGAVPARAADCPSQDAVAAELQRLGATAAIASVGTPEIRVDSARMRVVLRGPDGEVLGAREVAAPASCAERARVSAVLLSAWAGAWQAGSFPEADPLPGPTSAGRAGEASSGSTAARLSSGRSPPAGSAPALPGPAPGVRKGVAPAGLTAAPPRAPTPVPTPSVPGPRRSEATPPPSTTHGTSQGPVRPNGREATRVALGGRPGRRIPLELAAFGFGIHDGDAGTFGAGIQVGYRFPHWLGIDAIFAGSAERERPMVRGLAAHRLYGLGLGPSLRKQLGPVFGDLVVFPEVTLISVEGRGLSPGRSVTRWGVAVDGRLRIGLALGSWRPFVFAGTSYALRAEHLVLDDYPEQGITISRWNLSLGLGLAYLFGSAAPR